MKTYSEKLKDPRWQRKRLEVMQRDSFSCQSCGTATSTLNVHHWKYNKEPWDARMDDLETLCEECHSTIENQKKFFSELIRSSTGRIGIARMFEFFEKIREHDLPWVSIGSNPGTMPVLLLIQNEREDELIEESALRIADRIQRHLSPERKVVKRKKRTAAKL